MIIVDINVVSELMRPSLSPQVWGRVSAGAPGELCTRVITAAEIRHRLDRLAEGAASKAC